MTNTQAWQNRIVGYGEEPPEQLLANPRNFRVHERFQQDALSGVLESVGVVQNVICNRTTGHLIDGHLRVTLAMRANQPSIPVTYVELSPEEEALVLATFDPITALAATDEAQLRDLLAEVETEDAAIQALLNDLANDAGVASSDDAEAKPKAKKEAPVVLCPECGHAFVPAMNRD